MQRFSLIILASCLLTSSVSADSLVAVKASRAELMDLQVYVKWQCKLGIQPRHLDI